MNGMPDSHLPLAAQTLLRVVFAVAYLLCATGGVAAVLWTTHDPTTIAVDVVTRWAGIITILASLICAFAQVMRWWRWEWLWVWWLGLSIAASSLAAWTDATAVLDLMDPAAYTTALCLLILARAIRLTGFARQVQPREGST